MNRHAETNVWNDPRSYDATDDESECVEDMLGRFGFADRAVAFGRARILGLVHSATITIAVFCVVYFGGQLLRAVVS